MTIQESFKKLFISEAIPKPTSKLVHQYSSYQDRPEVSFENLIEYHEKTPQIQVGVTGYSKLICGTELQVNADDEKAKKIIEDWNQQTNFYDKLEAMITTLLVCGAALLEKLDEKLIQDVLEVDMRSILDKKTDVFGKTEYYIQQTDSGQTHLGEGIPDKFIEFNLSNFSRTKWGKSIFHSIAQPRTVRDRSMMPLVEVLWAVEDAMGSIIVNNAYPLTYYTFENVSEDDFNKEVEKLKKQKPGDTHVGTKKPEIDIFETQPNSKYTDYITHIEKVIQLGIKFPHDIMTGDFTSRASSDTTEDLTMKIAKGFQKYITNKLKHELYDPILSQNGVDPKKANLTVGFVSDNIVELTPDQVLSRVEKKLWTIQEGREWDKNNLSADLFDDDKINIEPEKKDDDLEKKVTQNVESSITKLMESLEDKKFNKKVKSEILQTLESMRHG